MTEQNEIEMLVKGAKLKAMRLLERMDRTEQQLRSKLKENYEEEIVEIAVQYVKSFGYIDDSAYARRYIENTRMTKSKIEIKRALLQKGVSKELIQGVLEEVYDEKDETEAIRKILEKKQFCADTTTEKEKQKMYGYLIRKGFQYDAVRQAIQVSSWNT